MNSTEPARRPAHRSTRQTRTCVRHLDHASQVLPWMRRTHPQRIALPRLPRGMAGTPQRATQAEHHSTWSRMGTPEAGTRATEAARPGVREVRTTRPARRSAHRRAQRRPQPRRSGLTTPARAPVMRQPGRRPATKIREVVIMGAVIMPLTCDDSFSAGQDHDPPLFPPFFVGTTAFRFFKIAKEGRT